MNLQIIRAEWIEFATEAFGYPAHPTAAFSSSACCVHALVALSRSMFPISAARTFRYWISRIEN
jgi:hypothetical protein